MVFWKLYCVKTLDPPLTDNFRILAPVNCTICSSNTDRWGLMIQFLTISNHIGQLHNFKYSLITNHKKGRRQSAPVTTLMMIGDTAFEHLSLAFLISNSASTNIIWEAREAWKIKVGRSDFSSENQKFYRVFFQFSLSKFLNFAEPEVICIYTFLHTYEFNNYGNVAAETVFTVERLTK